MVFGGIFFVQIFIISFLKNRYVLFTANTRQIGSAYTRAFAIYWYEQNERF
jgi:hypothetical protein